MPKSIVCLFVLIACSLVFTSERASAQTAPNSSRPSSEQSLQELVNEVRQLRATLQRINAAVYKGQVMLERLKLQQEQVVRISRELTEVRDRLNDIKAQQIKMKEMLARVESGVEAGITDKKELAGIKAEMESFNERETGLAARETRLANELELERAKLNDLNDRLNTLELDMAPK